MSNPTKVINYTPEQTALVLQLYAEQVSLEEISATLQKSKHSLVAKLCREGVYITQPQEAKRMKKKDMLARIESILELEEGSLDTLEKGSHESLTTLLRAIDLAD